MKSKQYFKNRKTIFFLLSCLFFINLLVSKNTPINPVSTCHFNFLIKTSRGLEIRYIILNEKTEKEKDEIIINEIKYPLFKTRESAIETIKYTHLKKDYTIVYVIADVQKKTEIISIPEDND